jgi:protocatechuate 3,4-dioxygenase alpha subunit
MNIGSLAKPPAREGSGTRALAKRSERGGMKVVFTFTINLQGPEETVFFDV